MLQICEGDITEQHVDAIVNAANSALAGGSGVNGAIRRIGGPTIGRECERIRHERYPDGLPVGQAVATGAGELPARWVIHTVGPIYQAGIDQSELLADAYTNCLAVADELGATSIAFPAISTGVYGYPLAEAARIAVTTVQRELPSTGIDEVRFVLFDSVQYEWYRHLLGGLTR